MNETVKIKKRYNRNTRLYDVMEVFVEWWLSEVSVNTSQMASPKGIFKGRVSAFSDINRLILKV